MASVGQERLDRGYSQDAIGEFRRVAFMTMFSRPDEEMNALCEACSQLARRIWAEPIRTWEDVKARAEVAAFFSALGPGNSWTIAESGEWVCPVVDTEIVSDDRAAAELIRAVLLITKGGANV